MWWFIVGGIFLLIGAALLFSAAPDYRRQKEAIKFAPNHTIAELLTIHATIRDREPASLANLCERCTITGIIESKDAQDSPEAPTSERQPVLYKTRIQHKDTKGEIVRTTEREDWTTRFWVRDDTGRILVDPLAATIELFRAQTAEDDQEIRREEALRVGQPVYILGWLTDFHGQPMVANKGITSYGAVNLEYIISWRSRQALVEEARNSWVGMLWLGPILMILGIGMIALGFWP